MQNLNGRKYSVLRLTKSVMAAGYGSLGPTIDNLNTPNKGGKITLTRVQEGVLINFGKPGVQELLIEATMIESGQLYPEGQEPTTDKAVVISKPAASGNPFAPGIPGNSGGVHGGMPDNIFSGKKDPRNP